MRNCRRYWKTTNDLIAAEINRQAEKLTGKRLKTKRARVRHERGITKREEKRDGERQRKDRDRHRTRKSYRLSHYVKNRTMSSIHM